MKKKEIALEAKHKPNPNDISALGKIRRDIKLGLACGKGFPANSVFERLVAKYHDLV